MLETVNYSEKNYIMDSGERVQYHKMKFIMNALNEGWSVKKKSETYIFTKKHLLYIEAVSSKQASLC